VREKNDSAKDDHGESAIVLVLSSKLHPSEHIRRMWPNPERNHRVKNLVVLRQEIKKINRRDQIAIIMRHEDFKVDGEYIETSLLKKVLCPNKRGRS
jgi:hypothetical protein